MDNIRCDKYLTSDFELIFDMDGWNYKKLKGDPTFRNEVQSSQGSWMVHVKSGMLHLKKYGERMLRCGRAISSQFRAVLDADLDGRVCMTCRRQL